MTDDDHTVPERPLVHTRAGALRGRDDWENLAFLGVPYGRPPVGELRFRPPLRVEPWEGVLDATTMRPACPQAHDVMDERCGEPRMATSEADALHLNVWTPAADDGARPVLVWIHGGSFVSGACSSPFYDGSAFARNGAVLVSVDYRLHALGFLDLRGLFDGAEEAVNLGLRDTILALEWIRENIAAFGGDPGNVTIFGESAGAGMVGALVAAPAARGLFGRAIMQSGGCARLLERDEAEVVARNFLGLVGVEPGDWDALRALSAERIVAAAGERPALLADGAEHLWLAWNNARDPLSLPLTGNEHAAAGGTRELDLLLGTNADENHLRFLADPPTRVAEPLVRLDEAEAASLSRAYAAAGRGTEPWEVAEAITDDQSYLIPALRMLEHHVRAGGRGYLYFFDWRSPAFGGRLGACHSLEIPFVFGHWNAPLLHGRALPPAGLSEAMHGAWIRFAAVGDPNGGDELPFWPPYDLDARAVLGFGEQRRLLHDPHAAELAAWREISDAAIGVG